MRRHAGGALEEPREVVGAHVHHGTQLPEPKLLPQVLLDVLRHASQSVRRQLAAGRGHVGHDDGIHDSPPDAVVESTVAMASPSCLRRKSRARWTRVLTTGTLRLRSSAISGFDRPCTSRSTSTVRYAADNSSIAAVSAIRNSVWTEGSSTRGDQSAMGMTWWLCPSKIGSTSSNDRSRHRRCR